MAVLDVASLQKELDRKISNVKLTTDKLGNQGFNTRGLSDDEFEYLNQVRATLGIKLQVKRSGTGLRVTFYRD